MEAPEPDGVLVRYDEIALKSNKVRKRMEELLLHRLREALDHHGVEHGRVGKRGGRIYFDTPEPDRGAEVAGRVFGVVSTSPVVSRKTSFNEAVELAGKLGEENLTGEDSFAIRSRRVGEHDFTSMDLAVEAGSEVEERTGASVDLDHPDVEIFLEIRGDLGFFFTEKREGAGGLPLGTQGSLVSLISGGIDSPVATWQMMRRGAEVVPVFLDNAPFTDGTTRDRTIKSVETLADWNNRPLKTYVVPHGSTLEEILNEGERRLTCVLCRRFMYRVAEEVAEREGCDGIITGESLGQVASQTYRNLRAEDAASDLPIYRPLIGMDKREITDLARDVGTFDDSTTPATCCTLAPDHPETYAEVEEVEEQEAAGFDVHEIVEEAVDEAEVIEVDGKGEV